MDIFQAGCPGGQVHSRDGRGGSGLGREIATSLSGRGAVVHICGRRQALLDQTAAEISAKTGGKVYAHACDIRDADAVDAMIEAIWAIGPLTGLFNNAAANFIAPTKDLSARGFRAVTSTVIDGTFFTTLSVGKRWISRRHCRFGGVQPHHLGVDRFGFRGSLGHGQDRDRSR
ncbi:SDR family NAD(P)-dependent oxidoreductase [Novosphingobium colocasiae]